MSKSPQAIAQIALESGRVARPLSANKLSPCRYYQAQLCTCLVRRHFFRTDYRGIIQLLRDCSDLRAVGGLERAPGTTLRARK